jgi:pimeloyl-ACP methyl ester carboxylesterase
VDHSINSEFVKAGGRRFEVKMCGDPASDTQALMLHGFPESAHSWRKQMPLFAELGHFVWAPNQRGYGDSYRPRQLSEYGLDKLVEDIANLIDASGKSKIILCGHDWGGVVAWAFAILEVRPLERLIIMNIPHPQRFREELRRGMRQKLRSIYALFFQIPRLPEWVLTRKDARLVGKAFTDMAIDKSRFSEEDIRHYRDHAQRPGGMTAMVNWYRATRFGAGMMQKIEASPKLATPTLMIWGEADSALGVELTHGTDALVSDLTLRYLPNVSHWVQQEAPEQVNELVLAWLEGKPVPGNTRSGQGEGSSV